MAAKWAGLVSLPFPPEPQDRRAFRAEDRRRLDWHRWLCRADFPNTDFPGFWIVPKDGGAALPVSKLDFLTEIEPGDDFRENIGRKAVGGQHGFKVDA